MNFELQAALKNKFINGWWLFYLVSIPMSIVMMIATMAADLSTGDGVSSMIGFSVRWAVPFIYLVIAASSLQALFPGSLPMWLLRNRKYIGMCFAVAMAWQGTFIFIMSFFFRDYYYADVYLLRDELEGSVGYIFLPVMVLTSFNFARKHLSSQQWKLIHKTGIYFIFAYPFSVYWWNLSYYGNPEVLDYIYYWSGFLAFSLRIAAWGKKRQPSVNGDVPLVYKTMGSVIIGAGLFLSVASLYLQKPITAFLTAPKWSADLVLWLPYWPFEPYLSLFIIALGTLLLTKQGRSQLEQTN